ncbi:hypothetical protein [Natronosalvus vescus]|uniref:hypothetical protein n=1 Tax=Natronosalvus vescus TaxID=2953881 RepID=UPI00209124A8|nr:hypothetical protein [Natronosalvus vescus]
MSQENPIEVTLENRLMSQGVYIEAYESTEGGTRIEYEMVHDAPGVTTHEVSIVVRTVLTIVEERPEWEPGRLEAVSTTTDGAIRGTWFVDASWFEQLGTELSEVEFSQRVLDTVNNKYSDS